MRLLDYLGRSIRRRITWMFGGFVALAMVAVAVGIGFRLVSTISVDLSHEVDLRFRQVAERLRLRIEYLVESATILAKNPLIINGLNDPQGRLTYLPDLVQGFSQERDVTAVALLAFDGTPVYSSLDPLPTYGDSAELRSSLAGGLPTYLVDAKRMRWVLFCPIVYYRSTQGALLVAFDLKAMARRVLPADPIIGYRLEAAGRPIYEHHPTGSGEDIVVRKPLGAESTNFLSGLGLELAVSAPRRYHMQPVVEAVRDVAALGLALTAAALALAYWLGHTIAQPILTLRRRVALADGSDEKRCAPLGTGDELEELAERFDQRTQELLDIQKHLENLVARRTEQLARAKDDAEAANRAKSIFLANMSHELRTPLNAILGFAQLLASSDQVHEADRRSVAIINDSSQHLLSLINDVLEISRIEAGRTRIASEPFDLPATLTAIEEMVRGRAEAKGLGLVIERPAELPPYVVGDAHRLRQVLLNLLGNAVRYTDEGHVGLRVTIGEASRVLFEVFDTGPGIAPEEQERIFDAFYQSALGAAKGEGTGLGLTISRQFVRLMGGDLSVTSAPSRGSTFSFALPLPRSTAAPRIERTGRLLGLAAGQVAPRLLVAEDEADSRELLKRILSRIGGEVHLACNGRQAVDLFQAHKPDLILMDMRMPVMDGYTATRAIRAQPGGERLPIVAVTASAFEEDRGEILAAGCNELVRKPVDADDVLKVVGRFLGLRFEYATAPREAPPPLVPVALDVAAPPTEDRKRVLLVDDDGAGRELTRVFLGDSLDIDVAADGVEAVELACRNTYDLILMDVRMPRMDGLEAAVRIRELPHGRLVPILALTGDGYPEDEARCRAAGMDGLVQKSGDARSLRSAVAKWLARARDGSSSLPSETTSPPSPPPR